MRIGFDAGPIVGGAGGVGAHAANLLRAMLEIETDVEFIAYIPPGTTASVDKEGWRKFRQLRWVEAGRWGMRSRGTQDHLDLFHGPNFKMRTEGRCGGIVTVHDLWLDRFPQYSGKLLGQRFSSARTKRTAWRAKKVITVSHFSAREIRDLYRLSPDRIAVIHNGVSAEFREQRNEGRLDELRERLKIPAGKFVLFVGGADPRKNHRTFLEAVARRREVLKDHRLLLVGDPVHRYGDYRETTRRLGLEDRVVCTGRLAPAELRLLYSHAALFVFPSLYEGFGMPVLEAMACGAPTITSSCSALPEVAGDAALLVDPHNPDELGEAMVRLLQDEQLRAALRAKGLEQAKRFTWSEAAAKTLALYRELCESGWQEGK